MAQPLVVRQVAAHSAQFPAQAQPEVSLPRALAYPQRVREQQVALQQEPRACRVYSEQPVPLVSEPAQLRSENAQPEPQVLQVRPVVQRQERVVRAQRVAAQPEPQVLAVEPLVLV